MKPSTLKALLEGDLYNAIISETPGGIEAQEAQGQKDFVADETLPKEFLYSTRQELESMGVTFGDDIDDLFVSVQLPEGWKKVPTAHSMWSRLLDERGRERASIFYKAAFYDRNAHISVTKRFTYSVQPINGWNNPNYREGEWRCVVLDSDKVIWEHPNYLEPEPKYDDNKWHDWYDKKQKLSQHGKDWLDDNYPDWNDVTAYWD